MGVERGEFIGWGIGRVQHVGQQPIRGAAGAGSAAIVDGVLDDPHSQHALAVMLVSCGDQLGEERAVRQAFQRREHRVALGPPQQRDEPLGQGLFDDRMGIHGSDSQSYDKSLEKPDEREVLLLWKSRGHLASHIIDERRQISVLPFADRRESQQSGGLSDPASRR